MKLQELVGDYIEITYVDGTKGVIKATLSDDSEDDAFLNQKYIDRHIIGFNVLIQSLVDKDLPIKGFKSIKFNRETYSVEEVSYTSTMKNTLYIVCATIGKK